jgi:hypothetical protein
MCLCNHLPAFIHSRALVPGVVTSELLSSNITKWS